MRILLVNKFHFNKGGAENYYFTLADALKRAGHEVFFFSMKHINNFECKQDKYFVANREYNNGTSIITKLKAFKNFIYSKEAYNNMNQLINDLKPDLAILNNVHRQLTTSIVDALYEQKVKIFWVVHDLITLCPNYQMLDNDGNICEECCEGNYKCCIKKKCVKNSKLKSYLAYKEAKYNKKHKTYEMVDLFITPSNFYRNKMIQYGFDTNKVIHIANPLKFSNTFELNLNDEKYFLFLGRLSREKGIKTIIDSMKDRNYTLKVLGTGPLSDELNLYVKDNNITNVELLGFKTGDELCNIVKRARCVVLPSEWYENGPYSAMEAMALGKPLIVSNLGGLPELVDNNINGYVYNDRKELSVALDKMIILDNESYTKMCQESLNRAKTLFNPEEYVKKLLSFIK